MRTFIAIEISADIKEHLSDIARHLRRSDVDASWIRPDNYHLTLKFLGEINETLIPPLTEKIDQLCEQHNAFTAHLYDLGFFPTPKRPRILHAAVKEHQPFTQIALHLDRLVQPLGFSPEQRFHPHITLARLKSSNNIDKLRNLMVKAALDLHFDVSAVSLFCSTLHREGAQYEPLYKRPLKA